MNYHDGCHDNTRTKYKMVAMTTAFYIWFITDTLCISQVLVVMATT